MRAAWLAIPRRSVKFSSANRSAPELAANYGSQTVGYQTTNVTLAFVMVLDRCDCAGNQPHVREQLGVEGIVPEGTETQHALVLVRIRSRRKVLSAW
jgi:hypothetical protein